MNCYHMREATFIKVNIYRVFHGVKVSALIACEFRSLEALDVRTGRNRF